MKKIFLALSLSLLFGQLVQAQNVKVTEDSALAQMLVRQVQSNKSNSYITGWRVQILSTSDRSKIEEAKQKFLRENPGVSADWTQAKPYYRLRAGAFATKLEAMRLLYRLKQDYPSAFPAKDPSISLREIVGL